MVYNVLVIVIQVSDKFSEKKHHEPSQLEQKRNSHDCKTENPASLLTLHVTTMIIMYMTIYHARTKFGEQRG
jgi:hypothetical protein